MPLGEVSGLSPAGRRRPLAGSGCRRPAVERDDDQFADHRRGRSASYVRPPTSPLLHNEWPAVHIRMSAELVHHARSGEVSV